MLVATDDLESLEETLAILADSASLSRQEASDAELAEGEEDTEDDLRRGNEPPPPIGALRRIDRYALSIAPTAWRQPAERLPTAVALAAHEFIVGPLRENPHQVGKRLHPPLDDRQSSRRGTYRVIYRIDERRRRVAVLDVAHRRDVYRTRG